MADRALNAISPSLFQQSGSRTFINIVTSDSEVCWSSVLPWCKWQPGEVAGPRGLAAWGCLRRAGYSWLAEWGDMDTPKGHP